MGKLMVFGTGSASMHLLVVSPGPTRKDIDGYGVPAVRICTLRSSSTNVSNAGAVRLRQKQVKQQSGWELEHVPSKQKPLPSPGNVPFPRATATACA